MKLSVDMIPVPRGYIHPPAPDERLPKHEFTLGLIAPKGSGKTTLIVNLLKFYKGYFHNILVFSPTVASDEKWDLVKQLPLLGDNKPLKDWIKKMEKKRKEEFNIVEKPSPESAFEGLISTAPLLDKRIPEENFYSDYDEEGLRSIMEEQMTIVRLLKEHGKSKHLANRVLMIFDDLVGSTLFSNARHNAFKMLNTNHRHYSASIFMVSQAYREIPKTVRTNFSCLVVFESPNDKEIQAIYEENSLYLKFPQWMEAYEYATDGDHDFMFINYQKPKRLRLMKNFDQVLFVEK
jgi:energy-coupling factor transporter ATP-binding protein EcfA2